MPGNDTAVLAPEARAEIIFGKKTVKLRIHVAIDLEKLRKCIYVAMKLGPPDFPSVGKTRKKTARSSKH